MNQLLQMLQSGAQGASNAAASTVSAPVDGLAWLLRKAGLPIPQAPLGGSDWMAQQGLTAQPTNRLAGLIGEGLGAALPGVVAARAPQIAGAMLQGADNLAAPALNSKQMGGVLNPLPSSNYYKQDLSEYTPNVFRETDIEGAARFSPKTVSQPQDLWFANQPEYALGQGMNKGVLIEMDAKGLPGQLSLTKPNARQMYESDYAEFLTRAVNPGELAENVRSVKISPAQQKGAFFTRVMNDLKSRGYSQEVLPDKSIVFKKP